MEASGTPQWECVKMYPCISVWFPFDNLEIQLPSNGWSGGEGVGSHLSWKQKTVLKLLSQDVFIAHPSGGLHKSEVPQKHAP